MIHSHFYNKELETLDRARLRELQNEKLVALLRAIGTNRFYEERFRAAGIRREDVRSVEDMQALPFTTKSDLIAEQEAHPPFGRLLSFPLSEYHYFHQTSGTTGRPLIWLDTRESWDTWLRCWGYVYRGAGVTEHDIIYFAFSFGPYVSHWAAIDGARRMGALGISGAGLSSEQRLRAILGNNCTVLVCTPTYALHLVEVARRHSIDLRSSAVRLSIHAGEPGASLPNVKRAIEEGWGAACNDHAGATEVGAWAFPCTAADAGGIHLNEAEFLFEVIDPMTGYAVREGERGELVVTSLGRAGMPVVRYRTGDLVEMTAERCPCGRTHARILGGVLGRADDMLIVRGVNLYPSAIDDLIRSLPHVVEYEVEIRRLDGMDDLLVKIERAEGLTVDPVAALSNAFRSRFNIRVTIEEVTRGSLPRYEFKARRFKRVADLPQGSGASK
jgi:phenylacetate-CoA ligase